MSDIYHNLNIICFRREKENTNVSLSDLFCARVCFFPFLLSFRYIQVCCMSIQLKLRYLFLCFHTVCTRAAILCLLIIYEWALFVLLVRVSAVQYLAFSIVSLRNQLASLFPPSLFVVCVWFLFVLFNVGLII